MIVPSIQPPSFLDNTERPAGQRIVLICDWLPPDFGAVGQYTMQRAEQLANLGHYVSVIGFSNSDLIPIENATSGLSVTRVERQSYNKNKLFQRALWTVRANFALIWAARHAIKKADEVIFTGSPPYFLHFIVPLNFIFWHKKLVYRITDFHPECLMAEFDRVPMWLNGIYRMTLFWRKRVDIFEAIGQDQMARLGEIGIPPERMRLVRDPAPVTFAAELIPMNRPSELAMSGAILYSGNFGVAHDYQTFLDGYAQFLGRFPGRAKLWLNAVGKKADAVQVLCERLNLPVYRSKPVPLGELSALLVATDLHLITLRDRFVGFVLPSKVYACINSGKKILFVGSAKSDVHLLCAEQLPSEHYRRVDIGDSVGVMEALHALLPLAAQKPI